MRLISFLNEKRTNAPRYILYHVTSLLLVLTLIIPSLSHGKVTGDFTPITTVTDTKSFLCYNPAAAVGSKEEMITKANLFTQIYGSLPAVSETVAGVVPVTNGVTDGWVLTKQSNGSAAWAATGASGGIILASQAIGDLWYASSANATARLAAVAAGQPLLSGGVTTAPAYAGYTFSGTAGQTYTFPSSSKTLMAIDATLDDDNVAFDDSDNVWTSTAIGPALEELNDSINAGAPNGTGAKVHWSQLLGVPAGFADGTDDVGGFTPTSYDDITWGAAAGGSQTWTWDTGSSTDPNLTISDTGFAFNKDISATSFQSTATDASRRLELGNNTTAWSGCTSGIYGMSFDVGVLYICENGTKRGIISSLTGYATLGANTFTGTQALGSNSITMTGSIAATGARVLKGWFTDIESTNMPTVGGVALSTTFPTKIASGTSALGTSQIASGA